jgi:hypothetical protein
MTPVSVLRISKKWSPPESSGIVPRFKMRDQRSRRELCARPGFFEKVPFQALEVGSYLIRTAELAKKQSFPFPKKRRGSGTKLYISETSVSYQKRRKHQQFSPHSTRDLRSERLKVTT